MPKVYSYIRFSSKAQATGDSLRRQTADTAKWAARHGYEIDEEFTFRDLGVSAYDRTNLRSGGLGLFLKAAQQGKIERGSILAIEALDRLTRAEPLDAFRLLSDIVACGIAIVTVSDGRVYDEASLNGDFASLMLAAALLVRGHEESKRKSERLKAHYSARRERHDARISHGAPNWIRPEGNGWGIIPEHAHTVSKIFQMAADGLGVNTIARRLNDEKHPLINNNRKPATGWYPSNIAKLLCNRAVIGEYQPHALGDDSKRQTAGDPIPNHYPAVVPEELFWRVRSLVTERDKRGIGHRRDVNYSNILSGLMVCGYCGAKMFLDKKGQKRDHLPFANQIYYVCSAASRHVTSCNNRVNYRALLLGAPERIHARYPRPLRFGLLPTLFEHLLMAGEQLNDTVEQTQESARKRYDALTAQIAEAEARKSTLIDSLEAGVLTRAEVQPRLDRIRADMAKLQTQVDEALVEMKRPDTNDDGWLLAAVDSQMEMVVPTITDVALADARAALRTRLLQRIDTIYLYRECARVKLRHHDGLIFIPLQGDADIVHADAAYPLPIKGRAVIDKTSPKRKSVTKAKPLAIATG